MVAVYSDNSLFRRAPSSHRHSRPSPPHSRQLRFIKHSEQVWRRLMRRISWGDHETCEQQRRTKTNIPCLSTDSKDVFYEPNDNNCCSRLLTRQETNEGATTGWHVGNHNLGIKDTHRQHPETSRLPSGDNTVLKMRPLCRGRRPAHAWIIDEGQVWFKTKRVQVGCEPLP